MNDSRHDQDCTWEHRQTWDLEDNQGFGPKWELSIKVGSNVWMPIWDIKIGRFELVNWNIWQILWA